MTSKNKTISIFRKRPNCREVDRDRHRESNKKSKIEYVLHLSNNGVPFSFTKNITTWQSPFCVISVIPRGSRTMVFHKDCKEHDRWKYGAETDLYGTYKTRFIYQVNSVQNNLVSWRYIHGVSFKIGEGTYLPCKDFKKFKFSIRKLIFWELRRYDCDFLRETQAAHVSWEIVRDWMQRWKNVN